MHVCPGKWFLPHLNQLETSKKPLEVVHIDLMGPIDPPTEDDEKYALVILDEFTEYLSVVLMQSKSEAAKETMYVLGKTF